ADARRLLEYDGIQTAQVIDVPSRRRLAKLEDMGFFITPANFVSSDGRWVVGNRASEFLVNDLCFQTAVLWDTDTGQAKTLPTPPSRGITISPDGRMIAQAELDRSHGTSTFRAVIREFGTWRILASFETPGPSMALRFSPTSDRLATSTTSGWVQ